MINHIQVYIGFTEKERRSERVPTCFSKGVSRKSIKQNLFFTNAAKAAAVSFTRCRKGIRGSLSRAVLSSSSFLFTPCTYSLLKHVIPVTCFLRPDFIFISTISFAVALKGLIPLLPPNPIGIFDAMSGSFPISYPNRWLRNKWS